MFLAIVISAAAGYLAGVLTPGVIRRLRSEAKQGVAIVDANIAKAEQVVKAKEDQIKKIL